MPIPTPEWLARYEARMLSLGVPSDLASYMKREAEASIGCEFFDASEFYEDDPEGAADEEMSYWEE